MNNPAACNRTQFLINLLWHEVTFCAPYRNKPHAFLLELIIEVSGYKLYCIGYVLYFQSFFLIHFYIKLFLK